MITRTRLIAALLGLLLVGNAHALCRVNDQVSVAWKGKWYDATVLKHNPTACLITYAGYDSSWDEWVGADRYLLKTSRVSVLWKGKWYDARVLNRRTNGYLIQYDGYDSSWNEWVDNSRIASR